MIINIYRAMVSAVTNQEGLDYMSYAACWLCLLASIVLAVLGLSLVKGMSASWPLAGLIAMYTLFILAYYFRAKAVTRIPVVVTYAMWEAVGLVLVILIGIFWFQEHFSPRQFAGVALLLGGSWLVHRGTEKGEEDRPAGEDGLQDGAGGAL